MGTRGSFIDTCGFPFAGACGPGLLHISLVGDVGDSVADKSLQFAEKLLCFDEFLSCAGSFRAEGRRDLRDFVEEVDPSPTEDEHSDSNHCDSTNHDEESNSEDIDI